LNYEQPSWLLVIRKFRWIKTLEDPMRKLLFVGAAAVALAMNSSSGHAMSINIDAGLKPALDATDMMQKAAVFIIEGNRYCFYFNGWHGPGWYRCGFAWRRNLGWGGEYGWQSWSYGPAERRYGRGGIAERSKARARTSRAALPFVAARL
jgi:hypothetical protein